QRTGVGNRKAGNAWLKWAFSEAAVLSAQKDERIGGLLQRLASKLGRAKALSALAHKLGRAFYHMLHTKEGFDVNRFGRHWATGRPASRGLTGADGASPHEDRPRSRDHESVPVCPGPQPRQPDALIGRRPRPTLSVRSEDHRAAPRGWVGGRDEISAQLSQ